MPVTFLGDGMVRKFLAESFDHPTGEPAEQFYDQWADTYDEEMAESGYVTPRRCARALAIAMTARNLPVLDFGCGTGLAGVALRAEGFTLIDGWDPSSEMLRYAEARDIYRVLRQIQPDRPPTAPPGSYAAVIAAGVFGPPLAPADGLRRSISLLRMGGYVCFSLTDRALEDGAHDRVAQELIDSGAVELVSREYGEHLRATGMGADVVVLRRS